jgi:hypothetical protein
MSSNLGTLWLKVVSVQEIGHTDEKLKKVHNTTNNIALEPLAV